jgi:hypothetical protein
LRQERRRIEIIEEVEIERSRQLKRTKCRSTGEFVSLLRLANSAGGVEVDIGAAPANALGEAVATPAVSAYFQR